MLPYSKQCIDEDDINDVVHTLKSSFITQGPKIKAFEEALANFVDARYCVAVANGTAALHLSMLALGIKSGDKIITSPNTFVATSNAALYCDGSVMFTDIDQRNGNMAVDDLESVLDEKTRCIVPVHFGGQSCDMKKIWDIAKKRNLHIIEDASHALGGTYHKKPIGSCRFSDCCTFSFHPVKPIATGEGGAITTNSKSLYDALITLRSHGITKDSHIMQQNEGPWFYEMQDLGYNYRITDIQASLGLSQLKKLPTFVQQRRYISSCYDKAFKEVSWITPLETDNEESGRHLYVIKIDFDQLNKTRTEVMTLLRENGVGTQVHYIPVYNQPYYKQLGFNQDNYPQCNRYYEKALSIPLFPMMTEHDTQHVINQLLRLDPA